MEDWKEYRLDELYVFGNGLSKGSKYFGYGHPFVSFKTVFNNYFLPEELSDYVDSDEKEQTKCSVQKSDVLLTRTSETVNELGYSCVALRDYPKATFNGFCKRMRPITEGIIHDLYAGYYFRSSHFRNQVCSMSNMVTRASLSNEMLGRLTIKLPSYKTQTQIGELLFSIDRKIALNRQINDNLEQQAQALYKSWFVDFEPFKDEEFVDSELGMIPKGWSIGRIEDLTSRMASGGTPKSMNPEFYSGNICWFTTKELVDGFLIDSEKHISQSAIDNSAAKVFPKGSVLMAIYAAPTVGRLGILSCNAAFNQAAVALIPKTGIESGYIYLTLYNERNNFNNLSSGAAQQNLNVGLVKNYPTCIPSQEVLNNFNTKISPIFMNIERNQIEIFNLTRLRDTLLPKLMSGELKINEIDC